jgi:hypothetical protein
MINVNQITSQLARMPDQALQQYAMMHKNDPYTVSLALSESNRRKQMRDAAQGQQGMGEQPKVVDQGIAEMLPQAPQPMPEDVGIGALPAPNMQGMAGGGIVAFGDGGEVQRFQTGGVPRVGSHGLASIIPDKTGYEGMGILEFLQAFGTDMLNKLPTEDKERLKQNQVKKEAAGVVDMSAYRPRPTMEAGQEAALYEKAGLMPSAPVVIPPVDTGVVGTQTPASSVKTPPVAGPRPASAPAPAAPAGLSYLDRLKAAQTAMGPTVNPEQVAMDALVAERNRGAADSKKELEADIASRADQFKNREERTNKRQTELDKSKDANTGMALLEAGLAMMQSRGPGLAGIAQGAGVGLKQYQSGIKDLKAAQEKLDEARDRTDELKQNQSMMDKSAVRAANKDIRDASLAGQQYQIDARMKIYGENRTDARAGIASDIAVSEAAKTRATQLQAAGIAAAPGLARNKMLAASQSDTAKARTEYGKLQAKVMSDLSADPQYTMATDAVKAQMATTRLRAALLNNPFLSAYAAGIGFSAAPAGTGAVRELDED